MIELKDLVTALLRKPKDGEVYNLDTATQMMNNITTQEIGTAHQAIRQSIKDLNENDSINAKERFRTLKYIDDKAQSIQRGLETDALRHIVLHPKTSRQMILSIAGYWQLLSDGYRILLQEIQRKGGKLLVQQMPEITIRAIFGFTEQARWKSILYQPIDDKIWRNLDRLFSLAEQNKYEKETIIVHGRTVSCESLFLRPHLLNLAQTDTMTPGQIDSLDRWLQANLLSLSLEKEIKPHKQIYAINLEAHQPAHRLRRNMIDAGYRYLNTTPLIDAMQVTMQRVKKGDTPVHLSLSERFSVEHDLAALDKAAHCWSKENYPNRKFERKPINKPAVVKFGLNGIFELLEGKYTPPTGTQSTDKPTSIEYDILKRRGVGQSLGGHTESPPLFDEKELTNWSLLDESQSGVGIVGDGELPKGVKIGELVGIKKDTLFFIGIVRRIQRNNLLKIGVELFTHQARLVSLSLVNGGESHLAVYLTEDSESQLPRNLLTNNSEVWQSAKPYVLQAGKQKYKIELTTNNSNHANYGRFAFKVLEKLEG
ncbi:hypothetical protein LIN78_09580 [Leeia sp. TBRC 13508]|uniref:Uncharacterized protein n=1 Tax=Leeia speluncae TaxID=2884804 RepID=A0ABS8D6G6_9NEIS|nr:hypothetical protein [Leeia speluncae]MCB6183795.1 hypothetical protein [Leeia speluncae]